MTTDGHSAPSPETVEIHGSASPYVGAAHSATAIMSDGWDGAFVTPNATNRNYIVIDAVSGGVPVGKLRPEGERRSPDPGEERTVTPGVTNQAGPAAKVELNPQPLPPKNLKDAHTGAGQ